MKRMIAAAACAGTCASGVAYGSRNVSMCEGTTPAVSSIDLNFATTKTPSIVQKLVAEAAGTFTIVSVGCGVVCAAKYAGSPISPFGIAATWGMGVALAVYATRDISGAHLNPAITAALAVNSPSPDMPPSHSVAYVAAQTFGATLAGGLNYAIFRKGIEALEVKEGVKRGSRGSASIFNGAFGMIPNTALIRTPAGALAVEVACTGIFGFLVFAMTDDGNSIPPDAAPPLIGSAVAALVAIFGPVTGCGMNPARDLGPRLVTAATGWGRAARSNWWVYTAGPVVGAVFGGGAYKALLGDSL